jgi:hypothetical protein
VRTELYLGGGVDWRFHERWTLGATARARIAKLTEAATFTNYGVFSLSLSTALDLWDRPDAQGPTIREEHRDGVTELTKE